MDKYQQYLIDGMNIEISGKDEVSKEPKYKLAQCCCDIPSETIIIQQSENCTIKIYACSIYFQKNPAGIEKIELLKDGKLILVEKKDDSFSMKLDFEDRAEKLRITFVNDIAKPCELNLVYNEADIKAWEKIFCEITMEERRKNANISDAIGTDLINIYFDKCCDEYSKTAVCLYHITANKQEQFMKKYIADDESFFFSITGLAFGKYTYLLIQYDKKGNILMETAKIPFSIYYPGYTGSDYR